MCCSQAAAERVLVDVVREDLLPVDLDDRNQLAVARLQLRRAVDDDLFQLELELLTQGAHLGERPLAEMTTHAVEDGDSMDRGHA